MSPPTSREPLSKHVVVDAALDLVDREGIAALSIRRLAAQVRVPPMSLYAHYPGVPRWSFDEVFDLGLRSLVAGIEARFVASRPHKRRRST